MANDKATLTKKIAAQEAALRKQLAELKTSLEAYGRLSGKKKPRGPHAVIGAIRDLKLQSRNEVLALALSIDSILAILEPLEGTLGEDDDCLVGGIEGLLTALEPLDVDPIDAFNVTLVAALISELASLDILDVDPIDAHRVVLAVSMAAALAMTPARAGAKKRKKVRK